MQDIIMSGLSGAQDSATRRARLGAILGVGCANAKTFLMRLNHYGVTRAEFDDGIAKLSDMDEEESK